MSILGHLSTALPVETIFTSGNSFWTPCSINEVFYDAAAATGHRVQCTRAMCQSPRCSFSFLRRWSDFVSTNWNVLIFFPCSDASTTRTHVDIPFQRRHLCWRRAENTNHPWHGSTSTTDRFRTKQVESDSGCCSSLKCEVKEKTRERETERGTSSFLLDVFPDSLLLLARKRIVHVRRCSEENRTHW